MIFTYHNRLYCHFKALILIWLMNCKQNVRFIYKILDILYKLYLNECPPPVMSACQYLADPPPPHLSAKISIWLTPTSPLVLCWPCKLYHAPNANKILDNFLFKSMFNFTVLRASFHSDRLWKCPGCQNPGAPHAGLIKEKSLLFL